MAEVSSYLRSPTTVIGDDPRLTHIPALDGLRGVAVLAVIAFHADLLTGGWLGVDLFFVLSGFLITSLLLREHETTGQIALGRFLERRARRLLPALFLLLLAALGYLHVWAGAEEVRRLRGDVVGTVAYVANWRAILADHGYWAEFAGRSPLEHTWSLAIEEQFYLVWPTAVLLITAGRASARRAVGSLAAVGALASAVWLVVLYSRSQDTLRPYFGTDSRAAAILFGAALATAMPWLTHRFVGLRRIGLEAAALIAGASLLGAWIWLDGSSSLVYRGGLATCGVAAALVVAAAAHPERGPISRMFSWSPLRLVGRVSYGLYLWHFFFIAVLDESRLGGGRWVRLFVQLTLTVALTAASYNLVEMPIRQHRRTFRPVALALTGVAALLLFGALASKALDEGGQPELLTAEDLAAVPRIPLAAAAPANAPDTHPNRPSLPTSPATAPLPPRVTNSRPTILVVGDSVAFHLGAGMEQLESELNIEVHNHGRVGCGLVREVTAWRSRSGTDMELNPACALWPDLWASWVEQYEPDLVVLAIVGQYGLYQIAGEWLHACEPAYDAWQFGEVASAIEVLTGSGGMVAVVLDATPAGLVGQPPAPERNRCMNATKAAAAADSDRAFTLDLDALICPDGVCLTEMSGIELRDDGLHYKGASAVLIGRWLIERSLQESGVS